METRPSNGSFTGQAFATYEVNEMLGAGGMGEVYRATDKRLNRPVAIKFLSADSADGAAQRRFQTEARLASALNHPHILTVHDAGDFKGHPYIVTEFADGGTLRQWMLVTKPDWRQVVDMLIGVADGLACAHEAGILHRDVKPDNILLTKSGYAKLADFGLAKRESSEADVTGTMTAGRTTPGMIIGSIAYMSPEQASGKPLGARSDIFSFGVVFYEMLAGRKPFEGTTYLECLDAIVHHQVPSLSQLRPDIPTECRTIVEKALQKNPDELYQSMRDFVVDLRRLSRQNPRAASLEIPQQKKNRSWIAVLGILGAAAIAAVILMRLGPLPAGPPPNAQTIHSIAVLPLQNLSHNPDQEYFAAGMTDTLTTALAQISAWNVIARTSAARYQGSPKSASEIAKELHVDGVVEGSVQRSGDRVLITANLIEASTDHHLWAMSYERDLGDTLALENELARAIAQEIQLKLTPQEQNRLASARSVKPEAQEAYFRGAYWDTKGEPAKALEYYKQATEKEPTYAAAYAAVSGDYGVLLSLGVIPVDEALPKWKAAVKKALDLDNSSAEAHSSLADLLQYHELNWIEAEREYRHSIQLNPSLWVSHISLADVLEATGRIEEAIKEKRLAQQLDPYGFLPNYNLGGILLRTGHLDEAIAQAEASVRQGSDPIGGSSHLTIGLAYEQKRDFDRAVSEIQTGNELGLKSGIVLPNLADLVQADLAHVYAVSGKREQALRILNELMKESRVRPVLSLPFVIIYTGLEDKDAAFDWLEKGLAEAQPTTSNVKIDPRMVPLRSDRRYPDLMRRIGLQP